MPYSAPAASVGALVAPSWWHVSGSCDGAAGRLALKLSSHIRRIAPGWASNVCGPLLLTSSNHSLAAFGVARCLGPDAFVLFPPPGPGPPHPHPCPRVATARWVRRPSGFGRGRARARWRNARDGTGEADEVDGPARCGAMDPKPETSARLAPDLCRPLSPSPVGRVGFGHRATLASGRVIPARPAVLSTA
jgi:hypothetical protein